MPGMSARWKDQSRSCSSAAYSGEHPKRELNDATVFVYAPAVPAFLRVGVTTFVAERFHNGVVESDGAGELIGSKGDVAEHG